MQRRRAVELIAISTIPASVPLAAQEHEHPLANAAQPGAGSGKRFFSAEDLVVIDDLAERILPADARSGGAREAKVPEFIDQLVAQGTSQTQAAWKQGLEAVRAAARQHFQKSFAECSDAQRSELLAMMAAREEQPGTELERFFVRLKAQTISGYYTSPVGLLKELEYKGIVPQPYYPPCNHPEHQHD